MYCESNGRPSVPTRLMAGLHFLKHCCNESDESVVEKFRENPYWQYFCGMEFFENKTPCDATTLGRWRKRVGTSGVEKLLQETIQCGLKNKVVKPHQIKDCETHVKR